MSHLIGVLCTLTMLFAAAVLGMRGRTTIALAGSGSGCGLLECRGGYIWTPGIGQVPCPRCNAQHHAGDHVADRRHIGATRTLALADEPQPPVRVPARPGVTPR